MNWRVQGVIYVIKAVGQPYYKVGWTHHNPEHRRRSLQTGSVWDLTLIATANGTIRHEKGIHSWLYTAACSLGMGPKFTHMRREWFRYDGEIPFMKLVELANKKFWEGESNRFQPNPFILEMMTESMLDDLERDPSPDNQKYWKDRMVFESRKLEPISHWESTCQLSCTQ
jgi:hypothetical protein